MRQKISIPAAIAAIITASSLTACSTSTDDQATSTDVVETATTVDAADAADAVDEFSTHSANPDTPPFPELGPFDPDLRGEDMPDPCTWATPEIMAELGYPVFTDAETFTDFRDCNYAVEENGSAVGLTTGVAFTNSPVMGQQAEATDWNGFEITTAQSEIFKTSWFSSIETTKGAFEVAITSYTATDEEIKEESLRVLKAILGEHHDAR